MATIRITTVRIATIAALAAATVLAGAAGPQHPATTSHAAVVAASVSPDGPVPCCWTAV